MSCYEQKVEPRDDRYQYLLFAAKPYETIGFKIPNIPIDKKEGRYVVNTGSPCGELCFSLTCV